MHTTESQTDKRPESRSALREIIAFTALTYALAVAVVVALPDSASNMGLTTLVPVVVVIVLTFTLFRPGTRRELWRSLGLRRAGARTWGSALGVPVLLCGGAFGAALLVGAGHLHPLDLTGSAVADLAINTLIELVVILLFVLSEEIGFRGFLLPRVQQLTSRRRSGLVTGFLHGLYHLPLLLIATTYDSVGPRWIAAPMAVLVITFAGVFYAWLWDRSGSVWATGLGHAATNLTFSLGFVAVASTTPLSLALVAGETGVATLGVVVLMASVLLARAKVWRAREATTVRPTRETVTAR